MINVNCVQSDKTQHSCCESLHGGPRLKVQRINIKCTKQAELLTHRRVNPTFGFVQYKEFKLKHIILASCNFKTTANDMTGET